MADPKIRIRRSSTPNKVPETSQLQLGELAINTFDGKLYLEQDQTSASGIVTVIAVNPWNVGVGSTAYNTYFTAGNVGLGLTNPTQLLDVNGDIRLRGAIFDSLNSTGTSNQVLVSNAGAGVTWANLSAIPVGDANTLDGLDSSQFLRSDVADTKAGITTFSDDVILQSNLNVSGVSTFQGNAFFGDNDILNFGANNDLQIFSNGSASSIKENGTGNLQILGTNILFTDAGNTKFYAKYLNTNGSVELYYDNSKKFETTGYGVTVTGGVYVSGIATFQSDAKFGDGDKAIFGNDNDTEIYWSGTQNRIDTNNGPLRIDNSSSGIILWDDANTNNMARFNTGGSVDLYHNGTKRLETTGYGVTVSGGGNFTGIVTASSFVKDGGTSSQFLKADGSVDSNTYLTAEAQTLDGVLGLGNTSSLGMSVGVVTATAFVGDGSGITNVSSSVGIDTNTTNQSQVIPFSSGYGSTTGFGATDGLVFNPSSTRLGIGSDAPAYALDVVGDINSSTDVKINGTGVLDTALALAIALG